MIKKIGSFAVVVLLFSVFLSIPFSASTYNPEGVLSGINCVVTQRNTGYGGWSNQSGTIVGSWIDPLCDYPQSIAVLSSKANAFSGDTLKPNQFYIDVSCPEFNDGATLYIGIANSCAICNSTYTIDVGSFRWSEEHNGYENSLPFSTSFGYKAPTSYLTSVSPTAHSMGVYSQYDGSDSNSNTTALSYECVYTGSMSFHSPNTVAAGSSLYSGFYPLNGNTCYSIYRITIPSRTNSVPISSIRITMTAPSLFGCKVGTGSSSDYIHSLVYIPLLVGYSGTDFESELLTKLDTIITQMGGGSGTGGSAGMQELIDLVGGTSDTSIINLLIQMSVELDDLYKVLTKSTTNGIPWASAIEIYLHNSSLYLLSIKNDTAKQLAILQEIKSTLDEMSEKMDEMSDKLDSINDNITNLSDTESNWENELDIALGQIALDSFNFDLPTIAGLQGSSSDFNKLWNALGQYQLIYIFCLTISFSTFAIRHAPRSTRKPKAEESSAGKDKK